ncbi:hypothetical protein NM22_00110 [Vibrio tubiashii]|nr:hypothetical protein NM22_00110 [Vibrio tubiashii]
MEDTKNIEPRTIGGLLILVALGVTFTPIRILYVMLETYPPLFSDGSWEILTTPASAVYSPFWAPVIIGEIVANLIFVLLGIYLAYLMFTKKAAFPKWYFGLAVFSTCFIVIDAYIVSLLVPELQMFDSETVQEMGRSMITLCLWTPYLFYSQRSKETFVSASRTT